MVAGQPVPVHAPARATFARPVSGPGRSAAVPGRAANVAAGSRLTRDQSSSARPSRRVTSPARSSTSPRPRTSSNSGAPLETTVRYWPRSGSWRVSRPRSNTQCAALPSNAARSQRSSRRSKRRWALTIGESSSPGPGSPRSCALSAGGSATTNASASTRSPPARTAAPGSSSVTRAPVRTVPARAEERGLHREDGRRRAHLLAPQVERRADEDIPEAIDRGLGLTQAAQERRERLAVLLLRPEPCETPSHARNTKPIADREVAVTQQGQGPRPDLSHGAVFGDRGQGEPAAPDGLRLPDVLEEAEVLREAAQRDVLAVVGRRVRIALAPGERLDGAAERWPRLHHGDLVASAHELERRREARQPPADDDRPHSAATARTLPAAERRGRSLKTSKSRARICSRRPP